MSRLLPLLLFALVFLWTPPHFWALALFVETDYANAGVPMLPVVAGERTTRTQIGLYTIPMALAAIAPWPLGLAGPIYGGAAVVLDRGLRAGSPALSRPADPRRSDAMTPGEALVQIFDPLPLRGLRRAGRRSVVRMTPRRGPTRATRIRRRQKARATVMAVLLGAFVVLIFAISIVKIRAGMPHA